MIYPQELAPTDRHDNPESSCVVSRNKAVGELTDSNLDREISQLNQTVEGAFADHETAHETIQTAHETIRRSEKSAVETAWRLGALLAEKKKRLEHGAWLPWLDSAGISASSASNYTRIARQIASAGSLGPSIRSTLESLPALATAKPKSVPEIVPVAVIQPAAAKPKAISVEIAKPDLGPEPDAGDNQRA